MEDGFLIRISNQTASMQFDLAAAAKALFHLAIISRRYKPFR
jgi:hypothetical protein